jgi:hypothetical protein
MMGMILFAGPWPAAAASAPEGRVAAVIARMEAAYARVNSYRVETEVTSYRQGRVDERKRFVYTFQKPNRVRIDMTYPHPGLVLIYPDAQGKVLTQPGGWAKFLHFHLSPDSRLLGNPAGQRIDRTDFGLLIHNIAHSLTDRRHGPPVLTTENGKTVLQVLAEDHFRPGVLTRYRFTIDPTTNLPIAVQESTPAGRLERTVTFSHFDTSPKLPGNWFKEQGREVKP